MSTDPVFSEVQKINPSAIIELFTLQLDNSLHGATTIYRFHSGSNLNANGQIVWAGNSYLRFPIEATGFAYQRGQIPRPKLVVSNALGTISAILLLVNQTTTGNDLTGATFTRIRTMARFLDAANFSGGSNPLGTPDPTAEFKRQVYTVDRKATETREVVEFELAGAIDMAGVRAPKRQCTRALFPSIGSYYCWAGAVSIIGPNRSGIFLSLIPLFSTFMAMFFFDEQFRYFHTIGSILVIIGLFLSNKKK